MTEDFANVKRSGISVTLVKSTDFLLLTLCPVSFPWFILYSKSQA